MEKRKFTQECFDFDNTKNKESNLEEPDINKKCINCIYNNECPQSSCVLIIKCRFVKTKNLATKNKKLLKVK